MSTLGSLVRESQIHCINNDRGNHPGESIIFVNGIMNELTGITISDNEELVETGAKVSAKSLSSSIGSQRVVLFYNPTLCLSLRKVTVGEEEISQLYSSLAELIASEHERCSRDLLEDHAVRVLVIAHSHGALLTYEALSRVSCEVRANVEVATFGGAKLIPNGLARKVQNFIYENDIVSLLAQNKPKPGCSFIDFCVEKREELLGIKSDADRSDRIETALTTHKKVKHEGLPPLAAQFQTLMETFGKIIETASKLPEHEQVTHACTLSLRAFIIELGYPVEILDARSSSDPTGHRFDTYLPKVVEVAERRS